MNDSILDNLSKDSDGMSTYEYIANNLDECEAILPQLIENIIRVDRTGQFTASCARFLNAVGSEIFLASVSALVEATIDKDRERRYIGSLLESIWGMNYSTRIEELRKKDDNFRRLYKRLYHTGI